MEFVKKHLITILCIAAIILLALPLATVVSSTESEALPGTVMKTSKSFSGFSALNANIFAYLLLVGPILLVAMNFVQQLEKHKGLLAIIIPGLCIISLIITVIQCKTLVSASVGGSLIKAKISLRVGIGAILLGLTYIGTAVVGAVTFHGFTFDRAGIAHLKESSTQVLNNAREVGSNFADSVKEKTSKIGNHSDTAKPTPPTECATLSPDSKPVFAKPERARKTDLNRVDEILALIERLSNMKDAGILTEEEFSGKKRQLLEEL